MRGIKYFEKWTKTNKLTQISSKAGRKNKTDWKFKEANGKISTSRGKKGIMHEHQERRNWAGGELVRGILGRKKRKFGQIEFRHGPEHRKKDVIKADKEWVSQEFQQGIPIPTVL